MIVQYCVASFSWYISVESFPSPASQYKYLGEMKVVVELVIVELVVAELVTVV